MNNLSAFDRISIRKSAVILALIFSLFGCDRLNSPSPAPAQPTANTQPESTRLTLTRGQYSEFVFRPWQTQNDEQAQLLRDLFEGLTAYDAQGNVIPAVAESWQTQDNKSWIFTLRANAKWSNGEAVTAADFVQSWQALAQSNSPLKPYLAFMNVQNAKAVLEKTLSSETLGLTAENDRTLRIELDKATPYLPAMLAHVSLLPQRFTAEQVPLFNGAYQLQTGGESADKNSLILTANPFYWAKEKVSFRQVRYQKINADSDISRIDLLWNPPASASNVQDFPTLCTYFYEFNLADPQLQKSAVRKALVSLLSARNLVENLPHIQPISTVLPKTILAEQESPWEAVVAEQLLAQNHISEHQPLKLQIRYDDESFHQTIATRLNRQLSQSDLLRVENQAMPWANLQTARNQRDFQLIRSGWCADFNDPAAFLNLFYSKSPDNKNGYQNAEFDRLFENALASTSEKVRLEIYAKLAQRVQAENLVLPIFQYNAPVYLVPTLMGAEKNPVKVIYSKDLWRKVGSQ